MKTSDFYYDLPKELIAQTPAEPRDSSRLLVYSRKTGGLSHAVFRDILSFLHPGDLLVANNTRVLPARLYGTARAGGGIIEFLLHKRLSLTEWEVLVKPGKRAREGAELDFAAGISAKILAINPDGTRVASFSFPGVFEEALLNAGEMPLPPYIKEKLTDRERYQTVYSKESGSSAAPTAGLHFTPELIEKIKEKGVIWQEVLLHVGLGTFKPVKEETVENHHMHSERYELTKETADAVNLAKKEGRRVIAVGTTSVRVLESCAELDENGQYYVRHNTGETAIFIYPPYKFKVVDALITNFHLPESTLLMLISALMGRENALKAYELAVKEKYRFFSFGDAMFIE